MCDTRMDRMHAGRVSEGMMPKPSGLALCVLAGDQIDAACGLFQSEFAADMGGKFRHAVRPHRGERWIEIEGEERADFLDSAIAEHCGQAGGDGGAQFDARRVEQDRGKAPRCGLAGGALPSDEAAASATPHLPGSGDALAVGGTDAGGSGWVCVGQARVQGGGADVLQKAAGFIARGWAGVGDSGKAVGEGGEVEAGATGEDWQAAHSTRVCHSGEGCITPPGGTPWFGGWTNTIESVGNSGFVVRRGPRSDDTEFAIYLHGVGIDNRAVETFGERQRER
jgi:hypothetical protein